MSARRSVGEAVDYTADDRLGPAPLLRFCATKTLAPLGGTAKTPHDDKLRSRVVSRLGFSFGGEDATQVPTGLGGEAHEQLTGRFVPRSSARPG